MKKVELIETRIPRGMQVMTKTRSADARAEKKGTFYKHSEVSMLKLIHKIFEISDFLPIRI